MPVDPVSAIAAIGAGITAGLAAVGVLLRHVISRHVAAIERVPPKDWFDRVEAMLAAMPTAERLEKHLEQGHKHAGFLQEHDFRIAKMERVQDDHEERLRKLEAKVMGRRVGE